jgi:ketosteroid isomerase-like protein
MAARHTSRGRALVACAVLVLCVAGCAKTVDPAAERGEIQKLLDTYVQSVNAADVAIASKIWINSPDVIAVTPLGRFQGWDNIQKEIYVNFLQKMLLERDLKPANVHIEVNGDSAWAVFDWAFTGKMANGQPMNTKGWESHVYKKTADGWRIQHLHYSGQPTSPPQ